MKQEEIDESIKEELAADGKLDEYDEQSDEKENEILQSHLLQMQQIDEDEEEEAGGGGGQKAWEDENNKRKKTGQKCNQWQSSIDLGTSLKEETVKLVTLLDLPMDWKEWGTTYRQIYSSLGVLMLQLLVEQT